MKLVAKKMEDGWDQGNFSFYCRVLKVSRQGFYKYQKLKNKPWKYQELADAMIAISKEDLCNDTYGRVRMLQALKIRQLEGCKLPILALYAPILNKLAYHSHWIRLLQFLRPRFFQ